MELGYYKLVYFTPEQLERNYILSSLRRADKRVGLRYLAMDEAHCISQWGHDFRPAYLNISRRLEHYGLKPQRIALTATASQRVRQDICQELGLHEAMLDQGGDVYVESSNRPEINLIVRICDTAAGKVKGITDELRAFQERNQYRMAPDAAIVFMPWAEHGSREMSPEEERLSPAVSRFAPRLECDLGRRVSRYHGKMEMDSLGHNGQHGSSKWPGDRSKRTRRDEQYAFITGQTQIMVATNGFGMGIDKSNIRLVIHRTPPANLEAYAQEAGRAGRDGIISSAILYFDPDRISSSSDYGIQKRFLEYRYIRSEDIQALYAFLNDIPGDKITGRFGYFTNDQAIAFFDHYFATNKLQWPIFQTKHQYLSGPRQHRDILVRGQLYTEKSRYLDRILSVAYRVRPNLPGAPQVALLEQVHETGTLLGNPRVIRPEEIVGSNHYFGQWLRKAGISAHECNLLFNEGDMSKLARRMNRPLYQVVAMASDIKAADSRLDDGRLRPMLLDFSRVDVPLLGPAKGRVTPAAWREYAGATKRVSEPEAQRRARRANRPEREVVRNGRRVRERVIELDDWFGRSELPKSRGWEIRLGTAFSSDIDFAQYLDAFMALHDQRQENDWASYHRLLTDYIGVSEDGQWRPDGRARACLRNVMLGYLKTYEIVQDGNCFSCSSCVPDGRFETDIEKRKAVVVRIGPRVEAMMQHLDDCASSLPAAELIDELFGVFRGENGDAIRHHVLTGWSGRLLNDAPDHRGALLLRLRAMLEPDDLIPLQRGQFITYARQLARVVSVDEARAIWPLFEGIHEQPELSGEPDIIYELQADFARMAGYPEDEELALRRFVSAFLENQRIESKRGRAAFKRLGELYAPAGSLPDSERYLECLLELARLSPDARTAAEAYAELARDWDWTQVTAEVDRWPDDPRYRASAWLGILAGWLRAAGPETRMRTNQVLDYLAEEDGFVLSKMSPAEASYLVNMLGTNSIVDRPILAALFADRLLASDAVSESLLSVVTVLGLSALSAGEKLTSNVLELAANAIVSNDAWSADFAHLISTQEIDAGNSTLVNITHALCPLNVAELSRWFQAVPPSRHFTAPPEVTLRLLECAPAKGLSLEMVLSLRELAAPLFVNDEFAERAHQRLLAVCSEHPDQVAEYVQDCIEASQARTRDASEAFERLLSTGDWKTISTLLQWVGTTTGLPHTERLTEAAMFFRLVKEWQNARGIGPILDSPDDFIGLRRSFNPAMSVKRADMLVAVIQVASERLNPRWLTPVQFEAEALCDAGRVLEAAKIANQIPDFRIGPRRVRLIDRIDELRREGKARTAPPSAKDYERILRLWFPNTGRRR